MTKISAEVSVDGEAPVLTITTSHPTMETREFVIRDADTDYITAIASAINNVKDAPLVIDGQAFSGDTPALAAP